MKRHSRAVALIASGLAATTVSLALAAGTAPKNGDFEQGSLQGWHTHNLNDDGQHWIVYKASDQPPDSRSKGIPSHLYDPPQGKFAADAPGTGGTRFLYRNLHLKADRKITLRMKVFYKNYASDFFSPHTLDNTGPTKNQQYRIDVLKKSADIESVAGNDVLMNVFQTHPGDPLKRKPFTVKANLSKFAGETVTLRLAQADNQLFFFPGVDAVKLKQEAKH